jgi:hypothetical protein
VKRKKERKSSSYIGKEENLERTGEREESSRFEK